MTDMLSGKRIVLTRARHQCDQLDALLRAHGAVPLVYPCIEVVPASDMEPIDRSVAGLMRGKFDWLILTSSNTVRTLAERLATRRETLPTPAPFTTAVIGPATGEAGRRELGIEPAFMPDIYQAHHLASGLPILPGQTVLLPQSEIAPPDLADGLAARGAHVSVVIAYRTMIGSGGVDLPRCLVDRSVDAVIFTSSSTVAGFVSRMNEEGGNLRLMEDIPVVCIGPGTAQSALAHGFANSTVPVEQTLDGVMFALTHLFSISSKGRVS